MKQHRRTHPRGFTLIELLVVILILAILASLIVPRLISRAGEAKRSKAASDIARLESMLSTFRLDCDRYPTTEEGLDALRTAPGDVRNWKGPYSEKSLPPDPWGNPYEYEAGDDDTFRVFSFGADGVEGGEGDNADVGIEDAATQ